MINEIIKNEIVNDDIDIALSIAAHNADYSGEYNTKKKETAKYSSIQVVKDNYQLYLIVFLFFCARFNDGLIILFLKQNSIEPWFYLSAIGIFNSISFLIAPFLGMILDSKHKKIANNN